MKTKHLLYPLTAFFFLFTLPSHATFLLNDVMSKEVQKKTGVENLSPNQKRYLEIWLNQTFNLKTAEKEESTSRIFLSINIDGGKQLRLSDGSLWDVSPNDLSTSSVWITPFPVRISNSTDPDYPFLLTNTVSGISIRVRQGKETPQAPTEQAPQPSQETPGSNTATPPAEQPPSSSQEAPGPDATAPAKQQEPAPSMTMPQAPATPPNNGK